MMHSEEYPEPQRLLFPVHPYAVTSRTFGERVRSRIILWARHLGDDVALPVGTNVTAIAEGRVVWAEIRSGSAEHRNWGGIVIIGHKHKDTDEAFFSLYGHLHNLTIKPGDMVRSGQVLGVIAAGNTSENGWWKTPHLHFGIYTGPWLDAVLPGYARPFDGRTKFTWWRSPKPFIENYNKSVAVADTSQQAKHNGTGS